MKIFLKYLKPYRKECVLGPAFKLLEAVFELTVPLVIAQMIDRGISSAHQAGIIRYGLLLVLMALLGLAASVTAQYFAARAAIGFATKLRHELYGHIQSFSYQNLDELGTSSLITRMTGDIHQMQTGINLGLRLLLRSPFVVFGAFVMAFVIDPKSSAIFLAVIAVLFLIVFGILLGTMPMHRSAREKLDGLTAVIRENLTGVRVIRAFVQEENQKARFDRLNMILTKALLQVGRWTALMNPLTFLVLNLAVLILIRSGSVQVNLGTLTQGEVIALYNYMCQILVELVKLANLIVTLSKSVACGRRVSEILSTEGTLKDGWTDMPDDAPISLEFDDVSIRYNETGDPALEHLSFRAEAGEMIGIIGGTGSGKTTLVNLAARLYDATDGRVLINGRDVREYRLSSLRSHIGIVPQRAELFRGTIRSNLCWGKKEATDEELLYALGAAQATDILNQKEGGLDAAVEQGGTNFSGGQKQRLAIARALVRQPKLLILDDSAAALDAATDAALRRSLQLLPFKPTVLVVSQRTASVRFADRILVLEDGACIAQGKHDELLATCGVYREIHQAQTDRETENSDIPGNGDRSAEAGRT